MTLLAMLDLLSVFAPFFFLEAVPPQVVDSPSEAGSVWPPAFHRVHGSQEHADVREVGFGDAVSAFSSHSSAVTQIRLPASPFPDTRNRVLRGPESVCVPRTRVQRGRERKRKEQTNEQNRFRQRECKDHKTGRDRHYSVEFTQAGIYQQGDS